MAKEINVSSNIIGIWNPVKPGEKLNGFYEDSVIFQEDKFDTESYIINNGFDKAIIVNGYSAIRQAFGKLPKGAFVSILYDGEEKTKKDRTFKKFIIKAYQLEDGERKEWIEKYVSFDVTLKSNQNKVNSEPSPAATSPADDDDDLPF